jgi:hypothetical protein
VLRAPDPFEEFSRAFDIAAFSQAHGCKNVFLFSYSLRQFPRPRANQIDDARLGVCPGGTVGCGRTPQRNCLHGLPPCEEWPPGMSLQRPDGGQQPMSHLRQANYGVGTALSTLGRNLSLRPFRQRSLSVKKTLRARLFILATRTRVRNGFPPARETQLRMDGRQFRGRCRNGHRSAWQTFRGQPRCRWRPPIRSGHRCVSRATGRFRRPCCARP